MATPLGNPAVNTLSQPLTLPSGLALLNRLVKCPMQETLALPPFFDPPISHFSNLYASWARGQYGLIITGQVQVDPRFLSIKGDVVVHDASMEPEHFGKWREWARVAQGEGTPCIVQLAHPGRRSPLGAGDRPNDMLTLCASDVPMKTPSSWMDTLVLSPTQHYDTTLTTTAEKSARKHHQSHDARRD